MKEQVPSERDRRALKLILVGERSTEVLSEALELTELRPTERQREVKRHRDRLMNVLKGIGKKA